MKQLHFSIIRKNFQGIQKLNFAQVQNVMTNIVTEFHEVRY